MTQAQTILEMLKRGPVTDMDALNRAGCRRLAARILDLRRAGHEIETERFTTFNGANVARYHLKQKDKAAC
jgi:hypothetical protein